MPKETDETTTRTGSVAAMTRVGNQTNSADPHSVESRVFVGNLNTFLVGKEDVERIFQRYGRVIGISMHKGYAFVQYLDTWDARNAVVGEDGRTVAGQVLDVNMVSEPKPHQVNRKRQNQSISANFSTFISPLQNIPPTKKARTDILGLSTRAVKSRQSRVEKTVPFFSTLTHEGDILICGNCKEVTTGLQKFVEHKRHGCKLRFTCRCQNNNGAPKPVCVRCNSAYPTWWELTQHVQNTHDISIYQSCETDQSSNQEDSSQAEVLTPTSSINADANNDLSKDGETGNWSDWDMEGEILANGNGVSEEIGNALLEARTTREEKGVDTSDLNPEEG